MNSSRSTHKLCCFTTNVLFGCVYHIKMKKVCFLMMKIFFFTYGPSLNYLDHSQFFINVAFSVAALELFVIIRPLCRLTDVELRSNVESVVGVLGRRPNLREIPKRIKKSKFCRYFLIF